jgi:hypothetical protein
MQIISRFYQRDNKNLISCLGVGGGAYSNTFVARIVFSSTDKKYHSECWELIPWQTINNYHNRNGLPFVNAGD